MFTRVVEFTSKQGKAKEVANAINERVMPILHAQPGFLDAIVLTSATEPDRLLGLSFWNSADDADRYLREAYPEVIEILRSVLEIPPKVRTFNVEIFTTHKIGAGKAA